MRPPQRHWRSYGNDPLPTPAEALLEPFSAFPSWFMRIECDRCGKVQMVNESHAPKWRDRTLRDILAKMRHDGCGGLATKAELLTGVEGVSSRPVRRIVLIEYGLAAPVLLTKGARCQGAIGGRSREPLAMFARHFKVLLEHGKQLSAEFNLHAISTPLQLFH